MVYNTTWQFLECQTCSRPTLLKSFEWCQVYDDGEEVNCESGDDEVVYPVFIPAPAPSKDMPDNIAKDFNEARAVFATSPRASAALLRLVIQKLCIHLGGKGKISTTILVFLYRKVSRFRCSKRLIVSGS